MRSDGRALCFSHHSGLFCFWACVRRHHGLAGGRRPACRRSIHLQTCSRRRRQLMSPPGTLYGPAAFRKRACAWIAEVADMYPACLIGSRAVASMGTLREQIRPSARCGVAARRGSFVNHIHRRGAAATDAHPGWKIDGPKRIFAGWRQLCNAIAAPSTDAPKRSSWYRKRVTRSAQSAEQL